MINRHVTHTDSYQARGHLEPRLISLDARQRQRSLGDYGIGIISKHKDENDHSPIYTPDLRQRHYNCCLVGAGNRKCLSGKRIEVLRNGF